MRLSKQFSSALLATSLLLVGCQANKPQPVAPPPVEQPGAQDRQAFDNAVQLMRSGQPAAAEAAFLALLARTGDTPGIHLNLALIHRQQERIAQALEHVDKALQSAPDSAPAHNIKGTLLRQQEHFLEAKTAYSRAIAADPGYPNAHLNLGILNDIYLKDWPAAKVHYQHYLVLADDPDKRVTLWLQDLELRIRDAEG